MASCAARLSLRCFLPSALPTPLNPTTCPCQAPGRPALCCYTSACIFPTARLRDAPFNERKERRNQVAGGPSVRRCVAVFLAVHLIAAAASAAEGTAAGPPLVELPAFMSAPCPRFAPEGKDKPAEETTAARDEDAPARFNLREG